MKQKPRKCKNCGQIMLIIKSEGYLTTKHKHIYTKIGHVCRNCKKVELRNGYSI